MQRDPEVKFFDNFARQHGDYDVFRENAYGRILRELSRRVGIPQTGARIADLGCGTGAFTRRLATRFHADVTGMDISPAQIEFATGLAKEGKIAGRYVVGDITQTGLESASFDLVTLFCVLHHFGEVSMRVTVLREALRIVRPGGFVFAIDPSHHSPAMWLYRHPRSPFFSPYGKTENEVLLTRVQLRDEVTNAGFEDVHVSGMSGTTFRFVEGRLAQRVLPIYNAYEHLVRLSPLEKRLGTFLVTSARKPG